jgi:hypothetical protein
MQKYCVLNAVVDGVVTAPSSYASVLGNLKTPLEELLEGSLHADWIPFRPQPVRVWIWVGENEVGRRKSWIDHISTTHIIFLSKSTVYQLNCSTGLRWIARLWPLAAAAILDLIIVKTMDDLILVTDCSYRSFLSLEKRLELALSRPACPSFYSFSEDDKFNNPAVGYKVHKAVSCPSSGNSLHRFHSKSHHHSVVGKIRVAFEFTSLSTVELFLH